MTPVPISTAALPALAIPIPRYDRTSLKAGVVHIGVGGFHRAHMAMYLDRLLQAGVADDWAICGMGLLPGDAAMRDTLEAQDYLYTLVVKHPDGSTEPRVIGSIVDFVHVPADPAAAVERLSDPQVRIVSLTITEGGYNFNQATGAFDAEHPDVVHDLAQPDTPRSVFGLVTEALRRCRAAGLAPFTVLSCDNIQGNGHIARRQFTAFAALRDSELAGWKPAIQMFRMRWRAWVETVQKCWGTRTRPHHQI